MSDVVIKVENLSKQYRLGNVGTGTLSHDLNRWWHMVRGKEDPYAKVGDTNDRTSIGDSDYVWALKDINFDVKQGEILGIIGKNGAGKSTLLKILSKVTGPTTGKIQMKGRVASLLEVGTGFHPELTGRENVFLNGAVLGMTKAEVKSKLEEIVDFSGVAKYIDTPVKRYSSGMMVRLGFAVAAHLEPEILIVDEVLAVGDAEFQKKAIGKMQEVSKGGGRTVLFVSHNMAAVKSLCTRALLIEHGSLALDNQTNIVIGKYIKGNLVKKDYLNNSKDVFNNDIFYLKDIVISAVDKSENDPILESDEIELKTIIEIKEHFKKYSVTYHLYNDDGDALFSFANNQYPNATLQPGVNTLNCYFPKEFFQAGIYYLSIFIVENGNKAIFIEKDIINFVVIDRERELGAYMGKEPGNIRPIFKWLNVISK